MVNVGKYTSPMDGIFVLKENREFGMKVLVKNILDVKKTINSEKAIHFNPLVSGSYAAEQLGIMDKDLGGASDRYLEPPTLIVCQRGLLDINSSMSLSLSIYIYLFIHSI